jgi:hypothetical protein
VNGSLPREGTGLRVHRPTGRGTTRRQWVITRNGQPGTGPRADRYPHRAPGWQARATRAGLDLGWIERADKARPRKREANR